RSESRNPEHMLPSHTVPPTRCLRRETEGAPARSDPEGTRARCAMQPDPGHGNPDTPAGLLPHDSPSLQATQRIGWQTCRKLTRCQQLGARLRALLSADTDQALVRARTDGEKLVGILRLAFIVIFSIVATSGLSGRASWQFDLTLMGASLLYGLGMLLLALR